MIDLKDVHKAIDDGQPWSAVEYLADQVSGPVDRKEIRLRWLEYLDTKHWQPVWDIHDGDSIDTRDADGSNPSGIFDPGPPNEKRDMVRKSRLITQAVQDNPGPVTPRQVLRDSEEAI